MTATAQTDPRVETARRADVFDLAHRYGFSGTGTGDEVVGPCPGCGGRDRFSVNRRKNIWRCRQGGGDPIGGDAIDLVRHVENCSFSAALDIIAGGDIVAREQPDPDQQTETENSFREAERRRAFKLWKETSGGDHCRLVADYLALRGIDPAVLQLPGSRCRQHGDLPFWQNFDTGRTDGNGRPVRDWRIIYRGPAMVWPITALDGHFLGIHSTWIDLERPKGKAEIFDPDTGEQMPAKKVRGTKRGGRIVLRADAAPHAATAVGEGVESVLSWAILRDRLAGLHLHTSVDLGNLSGKSARTIAHSTKLQNRRDDRKIALRIPGPDPKPGEDQALLYATDPASAAIILLGDGDSDDETTRAAMMRAKARLIRPGLNIAIDWPKPGHDFNSQLMEGKRE